MEVRGSVTDRPWGVTVGAIALRRHTGQLTIESDGKRYAIVFQGGVIVAASSPVAADALPRIALTNHFITSTQIADITRRIAAAPDRDEVEVLADAIRCSPDQVGKLRHRLVAQRAARTFSLEHGEFLLEDRATLPVVAGVAIDHRHAIYLGVRTNLAEQRLIDDLRQLGSYFVLKPEAIDELPRFGFEPSAHPVLEALKLGTGLPELEASHRELDPRSVQAIIYALVSCTACVIVPRTATQPSVSRTAAATPPRGQPAGPGSLDAGLERGERKPPADRVPLMNTVIRTVKPEPARTSTAPREALTTAPARGPARLDAPPAFPDGTIGPEPAGAPGAPVPHVAQGTAPHPDGRTGSPFVSRAATASPTAYSSAAAQDTGTNTPAATRSKLPPPHSPAALPAATGSAARLRAPTASPGSPGPSAAPPEAPAVRLHPPAGAASPSTPRPAVSRTPTSEAEVMRGFADQRTPSGFPEQRTPGFGDQRTPSDQRTPTDPEFPRTPSGGPTPSLVSTEDALAAEAAFKRGEAAMKRDQPSEAILEYKAACQRNPAEVDYAAMLGWAKFCAAGDKAAIGAETRKILERAVFKSHRPERARFYLGRVERMLGRDKEALRHFQEVLELKPNHAEAASEVRAIEARLQAGKPGPGLFGRKR